MFCTDLTLVRQGPNHFSATPLYCRSWGCDICQPRRLRGLRAKCRNGDPRTFITLTVNPAWGRSPDHRATRLVEAWRNIRQYCKRKGIADKIPFIAVFEATKRGEPHLHILCRAPYIDQRLLKRLMRKYMRAIIVDIRRVKSAAGAAKYVSKYVSKSPTVFKGTKRYWASRDYEIPFDDGYRPPAGTTYIVRERYDTFMQSMMQCHVIRAEVMGGGKRRFSHIANYVNFGDYWPP